MIYTNTAYLLLGSNMGNRVQYLTHALAELEQHGNINACSAIYETEAWGGITQQAFLNQVVEIRTAYSAETLLNTILTIEKKAVRNRAEKYGPRTLDIDILFYNNWISHSKQLTIPHPLLHERKFTLVPLAEIVPNFVHPILKQTVQQLLLQCNDPLHVYKYQP
jgi:2-amino-4-hydroxy-6-hydroxymethyldihydropteridine diphosphokinase